MGAVSIDNVRKSYGNMEVLHGVSVDIADGEVTRVHLAFQAPDKQTVHAFHRAALSAGGRDNGAPGERPYHPGYYAAFALDPDGNNIEVVYHGPGERTAASVVVTAADIA